MFEFYDELKVFFWKKRWLIDFENIPGNINYDVKWKCSFSKYKCIFFSVSKRAMTIAKIYAFNRGKEVRHRKKSVTVELQTSLNKTWEALPGKTVMWWKEPTVKKAIAWNLALSPTSWLRTSFQPFSEPWFSYLKKRHNNNYLIWLFCLSSEIMKVKHETSVQR